MRTSEDHRPVRGTGSDHVVTLAGEGFPRLPLPLRRPHEEKARRPPELDDAESYAVLGED
ncbi:hypothetical protein AB0K51_13280 [Kitasatospora sp. NPDC049285]|uniref:hypothetical protein n=1 Tax=Kitasatospora sp. NPDC049285 TaxID=3157096 RepID=UPI003448F90D